MNDRTKTGLAILEAALLLGILGDVLLRQIPWGLNVLLFVGALVGALVMLIWRRKPEFWNAQTIALNGALVFFAAMFVWRDSIQLQTFDALAILTILAVLTLPAIQIKRHIAGVFHYAVSFLWSGISVLFAPFLLFFNDVEWKSIPQTGWSKHLISVLRGLLIAAPLLLIFGALFVAADAVFQGIIERTFNVEPDVVVGHIFFVGFFTWIIAGYLRGSLVESFSTDVKQTFLDVEEDNDKKQALSITDIKDENEPQAEEKPKTEEKKKWQWQDFDNSILPPVFTLGAIEISVVLGLINLLFLSFVIVQLPYLFGGMTLVQNTPDFKLAEYARRGFGELVAVAALVLPILLVSHWLLRKDRPVNEKIYRVLAVIQIGLLFVIMLSAVQRLLLLTGNLGYGLTTVRFYPMAFMVLLALVFVWFGLTVLRGARRQFAWGALWLALFTLGTLHVLNPDDFIVRTNVRLMQEGRAFDARYNAYLSDDAVPALIEGLPSMSFEDQCVIKYKLYQQEFDSEKDADLRSFNLSRWMAPRTIKADPKLTQVAACPSYTGSIFSGE
ncbi:MAG: DUF4173 domain-containing protein [Pyrinomonadaceae bacterium]